MWPTNLGMQVSYVVGIVVILLFAITFLTLFILYYKSRKKNIENHIEDTDITKEIHEDRTSYDKHKHKYTFIESVKKTQKSDKKVSDVFNVILDILYFVVFIFLIVSMRIRSDNGLVWFGNNALMVVETSSMETLYSGNTYLKENGLSDDKYRIPQYSLVVIDKDPAKLANIQQYEVIVFKMYDETLQSDINVIHRVIEINKDSSGNVTSYTTRGDSNSGSLTTETNIPVNTGASTDRIFAVFGGFDSSTNKIYQGWRNTVLGYFVVYLQSAIGIITVVIAIIILILYSIFYDKITTCHDKRYDELVMEAWEIEEADVKENTDPVQVNTALTLGSGFGKLLILTCLKRKDSKHPYFYQGKLVKKPIVFAFNDVRASIHYDGYVLKGDAKEIFSLSNAASSLTDKGDVYLTANPDSLLSFSGDETKKYAFTLEIRVLPKGQKWLIVTPAALREQPETSIYHAYPAKKSL